MPIRRFASRLFRKASDTRDVAFSGKYLIVTNILLSMGISTTGDCIEQNYELFRKEIDLYDYNRTMQMSFSGVFAGVVCHHWYNFLDKVIVGKSWDMALRKLFLDQCLFSPLLIVAFFASVAILEENPMKNFTEEVGSKFLILYKAEWVVWPPAQLINFYFLPNRYRVLYDNTISLGYDIYSSKVKHSKPHKVDKDD